MTEKNETKCPHCGETENIIIKSRTPTFDGEVITYNA